MNDRNDGQTYYELLEVKPNAGPSEIYSAYQRARTTYSPNSPALYSMFTPEEAKQLMALIEEAYQTLSHQARRKEYDVKIGIAKHSPMVSSAVPKKKDPAPQPAQPVKQQPKEPSRTSDGGWVGAVKTAGKKEDVPKGFARTKFSVYEIKPDVESEIETKEEVDGLFLQKIRLYKGVTLDQMSDEIRVAKSTLVALEANDTDALPVAVFTRGFVVQFARILGLNERRIVDAYMKYFRAKRS
jgi:hypothetical protein